MKALTFILLAIASQGCWAESDCEVTTKDLTFATPVLDDIANTFWQDGKEGYETIKRLHITFEDGSIAVLEHKFCTVYNFEVAYYVSDRNTISTAAEIEKKANLFFSYASLKDASQQEAITTMTKKITDKKFNYKSSMSVGHRGFDPRYGASEYHIDYRPLGEVSIHEAALTVYMGLGVMH